MAEDILNKETAVQRMHERMVRRRRIALNKRINVVVVVSLCVLTLLVIASTWVFASYTPPLALPDSVTIHTVVASDQDQLQESDFVGGLEGTGISVSIAGYGKDRFGWQEVDLKFTCGQETCTRKAMLYRFQLKPTVTVPLGQEGQLTARDFVPDETIPATLTTGLTEGAGGRFSVQLVCNEKEYTVEYVVTEDIPPQGVGKTVTVEADTMPEAELFVGELQDHSPVTVTYKVRPDVITLGKRPVTVVLTDYFGNATEIEATINVVAAADGPQFSGLETIYLQQGTAISYKAGVQVTDAQDGQLNFTIDAGDLDTQVLGRYTVYYSAVDSDGNRVIAPRTIVVESTAGQLLREKVEEVLAKIIQPGMTQDEKIRAVFNYSDWNVSYVGTSDKSSLENAAYVGLTQKKGDCYTFYAVIRVLLDALDIPNLEVRRVGGTSEHWWNLVQFEDGKYYHVDATTRTIAWFTHFKMTESMLQEYTNNPDVMNHRPNYYVYDHTLPEYQDIEIAQ